MENYEKQMMMSSLNLIYDYMILSENENALKVTEWLIEIVRYINCEKINFVTFEKENQIVEKLFLIQKIWRCERLKYAIDMDLNLESKMIRHHGYLKKICLFIFSDMDTEFGEQDIRISCKKKNNKIMLTMEEANSGLLKTEVIEIEAF